jgi:hypothetical protein
LRIIIKNIKFRQYIIIYIEKTQVSQEIKWVTKNQKGLNFLGLGSDQGAKSNFEVREQRTQSNCLNNNSKN